MDVLELLLRKEISKLPEKEIRHKRLSKECGADVTFLLRGMPYETAHEITTSNRDDIEVHIVLAGLIEPSLKNNDLMKKYGAATPAELVKKLFLPGEITDISRAIERLSGYRIDTLEEVKKK